MFRSTLLAGIALTALTCAYTWPLAIHVASAVPHDRGDPLLVTWILWWSTKALPLTQHWWNAPAFYPSTGVLGFSENLLSLVPIAAPFLAFTSTPLLAYNVLFLLSYVLSRAGCLLLRARAHVATRRGVRRRDRVRVRTLPTLASESSAAALVVLDAGFARRAASVLDRTGDRRSRSCLPRAWLLQALASGYYMFFLSLLVVLWLAWFGIRRLDARQLATIAVCWIAAAIIMTPLLLGYRGIHLQYGSRTESRGIAYYSADIAGIVSASRESLLWSGLHAVREIEAEMFPGITIVLLAGAGLVMAARRGVEHRSTLTFYSLAALLMWLLTLGPRPSLLGRPLGISGPYALLMYLPGFDEMRVPARLWMLAVLCLSARGSADDCADSIRPPQTDGRHGRAWLGCCSTDGRDSFALAAAPARRPGSPALRSRGSACRSPRTRPNRCFATIEDGLPVFNGYSGYEAPQHPALRDLLDRRDPMILERLASSGPIQIVVEHAARRRWIVATLCRGGSGARRLDDGAGWSRFELLPRPMPPPFIASGVPVRLRTSTPM